MAFFTSRQQKNNNAFVAKPDVQPPLTPEQFQAQYREKLTQALSGDNQETEQLLRTAEAKATLMSMQCMILCAVKDRVTVLSNNSNYSDAQIPAVTILHSEPVQYLFSKLPVLKLSLPTVSNIDDSVSMHAFNSQIDHANPAELLGYVIQPLSVLIHHAIEQAPALDQRSVALESENYFDFRDFREGTVSNAVAVSQEFEAEFMTSIERLDSDKLKKNVLDGLMYAKKQFACLADECVEQYPARDEGSFADKLRETVKSILPPPELIFNLCAAVELVSMITVVVSTWGYGSSTDTSEAAPSFPSMGM